MKKVHIILIVILGIFAAACEQENTETEFSIDTPVNFQVSKGDFVDKIVLSWNNPPKTERVEVFRFDSTQNNYVSIGYSETSEYTDLINFIPDSYYYYKIRVNNSTEEQSDFTNYDYGFVTNLGTPYITKIGYGESDNHVAIEWNSVLGAESYIVERSENNIDYEEIEVTEFESYYDSENLISGKTYYYKILAVNPNLAKPVYSKPDSGYILEKYQFFDSFGDFGYGYGIEFDGNNNIYISDNQTGKIKVYNSDLSFNKELISTNTILRGLGWSNDGYLLAVNSGAGRLLKINLSGEIISDFYVSNSIILREVATDMDGNLFITDMQNKEVIKLNSSGEFINKWKMQQSGASNSSFYVGGIEYMDDNLYVSGVNYSDYVEIFSTNGDFLSKWDFNYSSDYISQDNLGNLYFACYSSRIVKTDKKGKILAYIGGNNIERCESVNVNSEGSVFASDENNSNQIYVFKKVD